MDFDLFWIITCAVGAPVVCAATAIIKLGRFRHEERMKMIEGGVILREPEKRANRYPALRNGLFMIGLALGVLIGLFVNPYVPEDEYGFEFFTVPMCALLMGGIGFVIYFFLSRKMQVKEEEEDKRVGRTSNE